MTGRRSLLSSWWLRLLLGVSLLAAFGPALPLAAPARVDLERARKPPRVWPLIEAGFTPEQLVRPTAWERTLTTVRTSVFGEAQIAPVLGTDALGRCLLARLVLGARVSLLVALVAAVIALLIGVGYGAFAGLQGGRTDAAMMRLVDALYSLPLIFLVIFVVTFVRGVRQQDPDAGWDPLLVLYAVIGGVSWLVMARLVRGEVLRLKELAFVENARLLGRGPLRILFSHLLPNLMPLVLVTLTLSIPRVLLLEAFLSFLGLGVEPPSVSWGLLAREGYDAINAVTVDWWLVLFPALAIGGTLLAMNGLGDELRDRFDVRLQERSGP